MASMDVSPVPESPLILEITFKYQLIRSIVSWCLTNCRWTCAILDLVWMLKFMLILVIFPSVLCVYCLSVGCFFSLICTAVILPNKRTVGFSATVLIAAVYIGFCSYACCEGRKNTCADTVRE